MGSWGLRQVSTDAVDQIRYSLQRLRIIMVRNLYCYSNAKLFIVSLLGAYFLGTASGLALVVWCRLFWHLGIDL